MKFDLERAFEGAMWAVVFGAVLMAAALLVRLVATNPVTWALLAGLALVFIVGGFWPRRK